MNAAIISRQVLHLRGTLRISRTMSNAYPKPIETSIRTKLENNLNPSHLDIINESYMHNVPKGSETHFKVVVVSETFHNESLIQRHRKIQHLLDEELKNGVHALSIVAKTPNQWEENSNISASPACRGGFGK